MKSNKVRSNKDIVQELLEKEKRLKLREEMLEIREEHHRLKVLMIKGLAQAVLSIDG